MLQIIVKPIMCWEVKKSVEVPAELSVRKFHRPRTPARCFRLRSRSITSILSVCTKKLDRFYKGGAILFSLVKWSNFLVCICSIDDTCRSQWTRAAKSFLHFGTWTVPNVSRRWRHQWGTFCFDEDNEVDDGHDGWIKTLKFHFSETFK